MSWPSRNRFERTPRTTNIHLKINFWVKFAFKKVTPGGKFVRTFLKVRNPMWIRNEFITQKSNLSTQEFEFMNQRKSWKSSFLIQWRIWRIVSPLPLSQLPLFSPPAWGWSGIDFAVRASKFCCVWKKKHLLNLKRYFGHKSVTLGEIVRKKGTI